MKDIPHRHDKSRLYRKMPFDPLTNFEYISQVVDVPMTLLDCKDLPTKNLQELSGHVKTNTKSINLANASLGAMSHLCGMLFQQALGCGPDHGAIFGHGPGHERPAGRAGGSAV